MNRYDLIEILSCLTETEKKVLSQSGLLNKGSFFGQEEIRRMIKNGDIVINPPLGESAFSVGSIDLTLSSELRVPLAEWELRLKLNTILSHSNHSLLDEKSTIAPVLTNTYNYLFFTKPALIKENHGYVLRPGEKVIAITLQRIKLKNGLCGFVFGRSRFARGFLAVEFAPFIEPGVDNRTVLEIKNDGPWPVILVPGTRLCKMIFARAICTESETYQGQYANQQSLIQPGEEECVEEVGHLLIYLPGIDEPVVVLKKEFIDHLEKNFPVQ